MKSWEPFFYSAVKSMEWRWWWWCFESNDWMTCGAPTPLGVKAVLPPVDFWRKRSTPFGQFLDQKEYSFCSIFGAKGVLVWKFSNFQIFQTSTPFPLKIGKKEYSFWSIFGWKGVLLFPCSPCKRSGPQVVINLYLCCLWCNLGLSYHFLHLQNLRNSNMASARATERGIVL